METVGQKLIVKLLSTVLPIIQSNNQQNSQQDKQQDNEQDSQQDKQQSQEDENKTLLIVKTKFKQLQENTVNQPVNPNRNMIVHFKSPETVKVDDREHWLYLEEYVLQPDLIFDVLYQQCAQLVGIYYSTMYDRDTGGRKYYLSKRFSCIFSNRTTSKPPSTLSADDSDASDPSYQMPRHNWAICPVIRQMRNTVPRTIQNANRLLFDAFVSRW